MGFNSGFKGLKIAILIAKLCRSQWPRGLRLRSAVARLLRSWVRIPPGVWMFVCWECCELSGRGLCDDLITRPEQSYRLWCVVVCDLENLKNEEPIVRVGSQRHRKKKNCKSVAHVTNKQIRLYDTLTTTPTMCKYEPSALKLI